MQDTKNRQNSLATDDELLKDWWESEQKMLLAIVQDTYKRALDRGIAKEVARVILPEGLTMSRLYVNGTIRSWIHYLEVRLEEGVTQLEHVVLARLIAEQINKTFKVT
jgi:thymidylate synthase (FAD)